MLAVCTSTVDSGIRSALMATEAKALKRGMLAGVIGKGLSLWYGVVFEHKKGVLLFGLHAIACTTIFM